MDYWLSNSLPVGYQNQSTAWIIGGDHVTFDGHGYGTLNGNGDVWYAFGDGKSNYPGRPHALTVANTTDSTFQGLRFIRSQMWYVIFNLFALCIVCLCNSSCVVEIKFIISQSVAKYSLPVYLTSSNKYFPIRSLSIIYTHRTSFDYIYVNNTRSSGGSGRKYQLPIILLFLVSLATYSHYLQKIPMAQIPSTAHLFPLATGLWIMETMPLAPRPILPTSPLPTAHSIMEQALPLAVLASSKANMKLLSELLLRTYSLLTHYTLFTSRPGLANRLDIRRMEEVVGLAVSLRIFYSDASFFEQRETFMWALLIRSF